MIILCVCVVRFRCSSSSRCSPGGRSTWVGRGPFRKESLKLLELKSPANVQFTDEMNDEVGFELFSVLICHGSRAGLAAWRLGRGLLFARPNVVTRKTGRDPPDSSDSSGPWKALFFTLLICNLLGLAGLILYKYRHKLTGKKTVKEEKHKADVGTASDASPSPNLGEEKTATGSIPQDSGQTRPSADVESSSLCGTASATHLQTADVHSPPPEIVGDTNIEELRRHAVQITIDPEHLHPGLSVTDDGKIVREASGYKPTRRGFPYGLCAFGAQRFTSGRHYWEVSLAREDLPAKNYWLIGVAKHGSVRVKDKSALTQSNGYWFLCSDGPNGFYTNSDPSVTLTLTPRPEQLGVLLDCDHGQLSFYSVKERKLLLTMITRFSGSVVPLFNPGVGDHSPLEILDCPKPVESALESSDPLLRNSSD